MNILSFLILNHTKTDCNLSIFYQIADTMRRQACVDNDPFKRACPSVLAYKYSMAVHMPRVIYDGF